MSKVFVGMSGGVDSSVTAALLVAAGHDVTGVFMKNWAQDLPGFKCPWREDLADAKRVAVQLGIPFKVYDFQDEYKHKVVDYLIEGYEQGITPNPDIMCNQEVKFKLFLETALADGAEMIATGHYAQIKDGTLQQAKDDNKDQTYFLYRVTDEALDKTLFPLGGMTKPEVREKAKELGLITADKKDSVGICFVGEIGIKDFLKNYVQSKSGDIVDTETKQVVGQHDGALFYTIGQRHGLNVGGGMPYYVVGKDVSKNEVYVTTDLNNATLWQKEFTITNVHWISGSPTSDTLQVRTRHRAPLVDCAIKFDGDNLTVILKDEIRALTPGQSAVLYQGNVCWGGGIII
ncbi:tRNA 2-thiouridine(34) synthase MnmA [Candidatus Saccharibacteria bacterium]|nr:tRNA 2-thiouridine(34) synthase MnmA [Candidatus Saccharibacteria bacterium]